MQKQTLAELPTPSISRKYICLPFESEEQYSKCVDNHRLFRTYLDRQIAARPELFPEAVSAGYNFHDMYQSRKLKLTLRRVKLKQRREVFTIRPSFVLPYCVARTDEVEKALYLRLWGVPFAALAYVFGRDAMFWYRAWIALGRANLVGATARSEAVMPRDLIVDEKITWVAGQYRRLAGRLWRVPAGSQSRLPVLLPALGLYRWLGGDARSLAIPLPAYHTGLVLPALGDQDRRPLHRPIATRGFDACLACLSRRDQEQILAAPARLGAMGRETAQWRRRRND
jgi:hypothetical protein